jgi:molybdenum cofactor cytidylyltransferase
MMRPWRFDIFMTPPPPRIATIILAAGASTRLGTPKQLFLIDGITLLRRTIDTALQSETNSVYVVCGFESEKMKLETATLPVNMIVNPNWKQGMSTSIRAGLQLLDSTTDGAIIALCDQPKLSADILNRLIRTYTSTRAPLVTCTYAGTVGVPTLYDRCLFPELLSLEGDRGAKGIIERYSTTRIEIDFPGGEIDLDTVADQQLVS